MALRIDDTQRYACARPVLAAALLRAVTTTKLKAPIGDHAREFARAQGGQHRNAEPRFEPRLHAAPPAPRRTRSVARDKTDRLFAQTYGCQQPVERFARIAEPVPARPATLPSQRIVAATCLDRGRDSRTNVELRRLPPPLSCCTGGRKTISYLRARLHDLGKRQA